MYFVLQNYRVPPKETQWVLFEFFCKKSLSAKYLGVVHIIRNVLGGRGQRFVTNLFENIGICKVLRYEEGKGKSLGKLRYVLYGRPLNDFSQTNSNNTHWVSFGEHGSVMTTSIFIFPDRLLLKLKFKKILSKNWLLAMCRVQKAHF